MSRKRIEYINGTARIHFNAENYTKDKEALTDSIGSYTLDKMQSAFKWRGLPETIPAKWLELQVQTNGFSYATRANDGNWYAFYGGLGGEPDVYYQPTKIVIANPWLKFNKECDIKTDGVLISNDTLRLGLMPLIGHYSGMMAETSITIRVLTIMKRITEILSAGDESTIASAKEYLKQLEEGRLGVIEESPFLKDLEVHAGASSGTASRITDFIEMMQYHKASLYNELGLQANYNMKRESINSSEAQLGDDALQPLIDDMLTCRKEAAEKLSEMMGREVTVEYNSAWAENEDVREAELGKLEKEGEQEDDKTKSETDRQVSDDRGDSDIPETE